MERLTVGYLLVNKFSGEGDATEAFERVSEYLGRLQTDEQIDLFVRPFQRMGQWHIMVVGVRPDPHIEEQIKQYLSSGEPTAVSQDALSVLINRQALESGGWVSGWRRRRPAADHN